jgi:hypothetical protein
MSWFLLLPPVAMVTNGDTPAIVLLCAAMTLGLLFYTFYFPLVGVAAEKDRQTFLHERKEAIYENLRDLNFEYRAGKYAESDYGQLRSAMEEEAAGLLAEIERLEAGGARPAAAARLQTTPATGSNAALLPSAGRPSQTRKGTRL